MVNEDIIERIDTEIKNIWKEELQTDYENHYLLKEDSLKNAFYFHLRTRLGDKFLIGNNLRIYTEYYIHGERIDLVIVKINTQSAAENYLEDSVEKVLVAIEMKYKNHTVNDDVFYQDIKKICSFIDSWGYATKHYFAFIQEKYFKNEEVMNWIDDKDSLKIRGLVTELYAYWDEGQNSTVWKIVDY